MSEQGIRVLVLVLSLCYLNVEGLDLPSYIPKCSLSDPKLNDCIKNNGNKVIPTIAKGDPQLGIIKLSPLEMKVAPVIAQNLKFVVTDVYTDSMKDIRITNVVFDLKLGKLVVKGGFDRTEALGKNYTIEEGKIVDISASGHGKFNLTMVGITVEYAGDMRVYKKRGEEYLEVTNFTTKTDVQHGYYYFENLKSPETDDPNGYIAKNWRKFREQMKPSINTYLNTFLNQPFTAVLQHVPLNKIFLP